MSLKQLNYMLFLFYLAVALFSRSIEIKPDDYVSVCNWGVAFLERTLLLDRMYLYSAMLPSGSDRSSFFPAEEAENYCKFASAKFLKCLELHPTYLDGMPAQIVALLWMECNEILFIYTQLSLACAPRCSTKRLEGPTCDRLPRKRC